MFQENPLDQARNRQCEPYIKSRHATLADGNPGVVITSGRSPIVLTPTHALRLANEIADTLHRMKGN